MAGTEQEDQGVQFPLRDSGRSTQRTGKAVLAAAARYSDADLADRIESTGNWRKSYLAPVRDLTALGARSTKDALRIAADGLEALQREFSFERAGDTSTIEEAFASVTSNPFTTATIEGRGQRGTEVVIPFRGRELRGSELRMQLGRWMDAGSIEPSCAQAVAAVMDHPEWLDLSDVTVALLGAGSEMGPLQWLSRWGANIVAVDLPREDVWRRIVRLVEDGSGRASLPMRRAGDDVVGGAGVDLVAEAPEVRAWLRGFGPLVLGNYAYADGAMFARVAVAADSIASHLVADGVVEAYAYLASPTEVYAVPRAVVDRARSRRGSISRIPRALTGGRLFAPSYPDVVQGSAGERGIYDCLVLQQGPNYALAKTLQRWRATALKENAVRTSATVAPATRTRSVTKNKVLAAAYTGAGPFGVEVFEPDTSRALTATLLVRDLRDPDSAAGPTTRIEHPYDLFVEGAAHGGLWSLAYEPRSVLPLAVLLGLPRRPRR